MLLLTGLLKMHRKQKLRFLDTLIALESILLTMAWLTNDILFAVDSHFQSFTITFLAMVINWAMSGFWLRKYFQKVRDGDPGIQRYIKKHPCSERVLVALIGVFSMQLFRLLYLKAVMKEVHFKRVNRYSIV